MPNKRIIKWITERDEIEVYFLRKMFILNIINVKNILFNDVYNIVSFKGEGEVHFLWK